MQTKPPYLKITLITLLLYIFHALNVPPKALIPLAIIATLLIIYKTKLYNTLQNHLNKISKFKTLSPKTKKIITITILILILIILKQILFLTLKQFGLDINQIIQETINTTTNS